jgi:branched-chain amino acid transport system permease protein
VSGVFIKAVFLGVPLGILIGSLGMTRLRLGLWVYVPTLPLGVGVGLLLAWMVPSGILGYVVSFIIMASIFSVITLGTNVQWGYTGLFNIGIAGFFAIGAFTSALITMAMPIGPAAAYTKQAFGLGLPFLVGVLGGGVVSGISAFLIGLPVLKLREDYLAIATIGIAEIIRLIFQSERWLANGPQPLRGIPRPLYCLFQQPPCSWLPQPIQGWLEPLKPLDYQYLYLFIVFLFVVFAYLTIGRAIRSPWGRVLRAIREDEISAAMSGKNVFSYRMQALVLGAVIMGIGGGLYAHYMVSIDYAHFTPLYSTFLVWVMLILGGSGNNRGAILGAFLIWAVWIGTTFLTDLINPLLEAIDPKLPARSPYIRYLLVAVLLEAILLFRPQGILGEEKKVSRLTE